MKLILMIFISSLSVLGGAQAETFDFSFKDVPVSKAVGVYAKESRREVIFSSQTDPKISILIDQEVTAEKAFELLSAALAQVSMTFVKNKDTLVVIPARYAQRSAIEVATKLPPLLPERMVSYIYTFKHLNAEEVNKNLRILPSKDGEMVPHPPSNQMIITDWISNIYRVHDTLVAIDQPTKGVKK